MSLQCGIVGLPNVGKSTLFNALTKAGIAAENYPFCTIEPNVGVVEVPDPRLQALAKIAKPLKVLPAIVEFVDIAGLVAGASKGEGLGNQFLANIRETDAIAHVVRCFEDENVIHVAGKVSPVDDIEVIHTELALADLQAVDKAILRVGKNTRSGDKEAIKLAALLERVRAHLDQGKPVRAMGLDADEMKLIKPIFFLTAKPALYVANVKEHGFDKNPLLDQVTAYAKSENAPVVAICAALEAEIADLSGRTLGSAVEQKTLGSAVEQKENALGEHVIEGKRQYGHDRQHHQNDDGVVLDFVSGRPDDLFQFSPDLTDVLLRWSTFRCRLRGRRTGRAHGIAGGVDGSLALQHPFRFSVHK